MTDLSNRIASLTPEQRAVFERLRKSGAKKRPAHPAAPPPIPRRAEAGPAPLSFDQERLWFLGQLDPESAAYNIDTAIRMKGPLDLPVLKAAVAEVVRRHAAWRTIFPAIDGRPAQVVLPELALEIPVVDLRELPGAEREAAGLAMAIEEARTPMDLARGPLVRVRLLRLTDGEHICLMTVHHIVSDWVSFTLAWTEIAALYPAFLAGKPSPLPEPPVQYADFAVWQRGWLAGETLENAIDFWTQELAGFPHVLELPTDRPRPAAQTTRGGRAMAALPPARAEAFRALARKEGVTLFMAALAAFDALLCRWSGQEKILVGSPNANRNRPEIESLLGFFVSQLVFATDLSGDPPFREILARARKTALAAYAHQELPFGKLVEAVRPERDASRPPLAQVNLLVLDTSATTVELPSLTLSGVDVDDGSSPFDTTLSLFDGASSGIHGWFEYNLDLWDGTTIARLAEAFEILVERVSADPAVRLAEIPLLREGAAHQVLREWNDTAALGDLGSAVRRFEERAAETPGAPALVVADPVFSDLVITYGELDRAANRLAHRLCRLGVTRESRVGLRTGRGPELLVGLLGIWKAGGAYVPLDPGYPEERLAFLLEDAGIEVVVTEAKLPGRLPEGRVRAVVLEGVASLAGEPETRPEGEAEPVDLAYVIYTSGTTGRPKGVMVEHGNLASTLLASRLEFGWGRGDRIPVLAPFSFDIFLFEVMSPLTTGGTVELVPLVPALDLDRLMAALPAATRLHAVPALMRQICALVRAGAARPAGLKTLFVGGDAVPPDLLAEMREAFPGAEIRVLYGPTEGTVICSSHRVFAEEGSLGRAMLGRPLANVDLRVIDRQGGLALLGAPGELWIGGPGVTRGYLNREDLTAEKFVARDGRRWYRTGDLARRLADGSLEFAGRVDQQVKVRGFRVEPGEIEARLAAHPAVREAVVLARGVEGGDKRLVAYVVTGEGVGEEALRAWVGEALPEYMVPSLFVSLPELPVTAHGKVDRKALLTLEAPRNGGPVPVADRTAPRTPAEEILAGIWRDVLRVDEVGVHDNFFRLGGDSILSIQVVARARQAGLGLTPRQMFESQTIAALAAVAVSAGQEEEQGAVEGEAPLTPIQLRFFEEERSDPGWFDQFLLFEVREALDPARLRRAVAALVEHHDALRLRFLREEGGWRQAHAPVEETPFTWIDGPALPEVRELQTGFDLAAGPLFRAVLLTGASGVQQLLLAAHHLIVDGVSWRILLEDLATAYAGHPLPAKTTSWKRWAERLAAHARSAEVLAELPFWRGAPAAEIPADRHSGPNIVASSFQVESSLDEETTDALLKRAPEAYRTEINDLLLTALARTLAAWTGAGRHRIELEGHGREEVVPGADLSRTVGWFTTAFPVMLDVEGCPGPGEAIRAVKETLRAIPNRGIGYGLLRYLSPEGGSLASIPEPEVGFNYLGRVDGAVPGALAPADEPTGPAESPGAPRRHLLDVDAVVQGGRLRVTWTASRNRHGEATVERLAQSFLAELQALVAHCLSPEAGGYTPSDFPLARLGAAAIDAVLGRDRAVEDVYPLAPLQRGMLFHTLYTPGSELYFEQLAATVRGALDVAAFGRAFQEVVDREPVLRTAFLWEGLPEPLQVVRRGVEMPWVLEDWRGVPAGEIDERFAAYAAADRARGFDLRQPPLQRAALLRTGEEEYRLLWSFHHLLFDGWCFSLLFREIFTFYAAWRGGGAAELGPVRPYREYIAWLQERDLGQAEAWWRERLSSFTAATPLPFEAEEREGRAAGDYEERGIVVPAPLAASLQAFAQAEGLTLNTLVQGAWALLLSRMSGARDVVFGTVVAGRPADLPGVEEMIGLFINTLPVRVEADPGAGVAAWLRDLQARQAEMRGWEWSPLPDVQRWSGVPPGEPLFHSLLVFENYPIDPSVGSRLPELSIDAVEVSERTNYPLTLTAVMRDELLLRASFDRRLAASTAEKMLDGLEALLAALAADPGRALGDLPAVSGLVARELPRSPAAVPEGVATAPRTAVEEALSRVWRAVLRLDQVGVYDDFFRLGGDSILSLQIVVKAREEGLHVTPKQIFENPTIAALSAVATPLSERTVETGAAEGEAPLTPVQRFFFERGGPDLHWFNQSLLLEVREKTAPAVLARATAALLAAHGALRLRFDGAQRSAVAPASGEAPFLAVDLSALPPEVRSRAVETASAQLQTGFDLARGPLFLAALFDPGRLLLAAHHLAVDAVSWRVLLEDLETACRQIEAGSLVRLPPPTLSWRGWAERLAGHARSTEVRAELPLWLDAPAVRPLPVDFPGGENRAGSAASVSLAFPPEITEALLREAPRAYNTRVDDLLLTALVRAFARWTGEPCLRLDLEAHGREEIASGIDLSRTVGWFTAVHPVTLDLAGASSPGTAILAVKERLRAVPRRGIGYGLLRWLGDDETRERLAALPEPEVAFNNLGQLDQALGDGGRFAPAPELTGPEQSPRARRSHAIEVNALVLDGRLRVAWNYSADLHAAETIERLAAGFREELEGLIAHCLSPEAGGFSPSDFPLARLDQAALDAALGAGRPVEDLYPLAPLQKGMLLHGIWAPESPLYLEQLDCDLVGDLDVSAFKRAWQRVVDRHAALRTAFVWRGLPEPFQAVRREVELPWIVEDFRGLPAPDERVRAWIAEDSARVFDLTRPPLLRAALLRTGEARVRFVWTFHHLLFDGWCFALLFREVFAFYEAFRRGEDLRLPEPRPYREYIAWLAERDPGEAEAYWRGVLAGFESPTPLPLDAPGAAPPAHPVPRERELVLSPESTAALEAFAQGRRLTVNTLVQAAWGLLLSRMADLRDVVFGTVVSGRPPELPGVESMVGLFINTLPVRMDVDLAAPVAAWLRTVQEDQVAMRQHEQSPLADVQGWSGLPPGEPLFHSLLAFESYPVDDSLGEGAGGLAVHGLAVSDRTDYPLSLAALPGGPGLAFRLAHDHRTEEATVLRLLGHLETLLAGLAEHPERLLGEVPLLTGPERGQLLAWSAGEGISPEETCLHQLFEAQAERTPDAVALVDDRGETTYAELDRRANRLAHTLRGLGVGPEVRVGLCVSRSAEMVTAILGILKAGGAYVPVEPETPLERLALLLEDAPVVVTESSFPLPPILGKTLLLDDPSWLAAPDARPASGTTPENLAYVIHTSGSTGVPKGVMVRHRSAVTYVRAMAAVYGIGPGDRVLQFASISFDASVEEIFTPLSRGAALFIRTGVDGASAFLARCRDQRLTHLSLPTAYWHQIAAALESEGADLHPELRLLVMGGERALPERWAAWGRGPGARVRLVNSYGPTEATIAATIHEHRGAEETLHREVPIGRPLPGVETHVLGRDLRLVPVSALGELCLGGGCLARGYLDRPDLTAEKFVPDPFGEPGARLYRTGDLARRLPDGTLEFAGRVDAQVKVRGFRIELGEVEAALSAHPGVKEAVATTREDASGSLRLVAFAVPLAPGDPLSDLRPFLAGRLPAHVVPSGLGVLDALPVNPAGKLDRRALDGIGVSREVSGTFVAPGNPVEEALAAIWSELLGVERVGLDDDFFALGGHSLLATQLVSRIRRQLGVDLPLHQLFELRTLGDLAREVLARTLAEAPERREILRSPLRETGGPFPLSFSQQRLWFIDRLEPGNTAYNLPDALRLAGRLDVPVLTRVLTEIVRRHEALRTTFDVVEGKPVQRVEPPAPVAVPVADLAGLPEEAREAEARRLAAEEAGEPFDVPRGPHLRARLLRLGESEHAALFTTHHIVSDGWSMGVLVRELGILYAAFAAGKPSPLPELPIQYPDFADWQRRHLAGEILEEHLRFWREALSGAPHVLDLPADRPRPAVLTHRGAAIRTVLPRVEAGGGETLFMVLLAAFGVFLARHTGQEDLLVASPVANRNRIETEGLIGFFVNTLTLRVDLRGAESFRDLLARVRKTTLGAYAHQDLPFERIVEELQPARDLSRSPLAQVALAFQNAPAGDLELPGLNVAPLEIAAETSHMDLSVEAAETPDGLAASWRFNADLFDEATVQRMAERFRVLLEGIAADPGRPLRGLPLLPDAEREQVLREWAVGPEPAGRELCLHELVFEQAARTPEAPALVFSGETVSYGELAARARHLAGRLVRLGVGPEARAGICLERSPEMVVAALGVLAAGGAYVPLDPAYPEDRLAFMAGDAGLAAIVASRSTAPILAALAVPVVLADREAPANDTPLPAVSPDHLAYVIYTSGSTGRPKGVLIPHRAAVNTIEAARRVWGFGPGDRVLQFFSFSFDAAVTDIFHTLSSGACLCLARREELLPGEGLEARLREMEINGAVLPPSVLPALAGDFPRLSTLLVGGERCPAESARRWSAGRRFVNLYGPTEVSVFSTWWEMSEGEALPAGGPPIGRPIPGIRACVVDREGRPVPAGVPGELLLGGVGLARGYHGRPERTAESFVPDPFSGREGERLYRTGDLVRWRPDGALEILGRIDHQVKLRGHRIEPGEIEASLGAHPDVREAAVLLREGPAGPRLVAYAVPREPGAALPDLRAWLRGRLPEVMVPAMVVPLDAFPLTPNGKLDRAALPEPGAGRPTAPESFAAPRAGLESTIAQVWREVLGVEAVGSGDNFFDLGGHSLLLVEAQARLKEKLGKEVALLDLFRNPNVASLARFLAGNLEPEAPVRRARPAPGRSRDVAVVGRACRFPGAPDVEAFWQNLREGVESISFFSDGELLAQGVSPEALADPGFVRAGGVLDGHDLFDAAFFDVGPREAQLLDPQQRVFLECSAEALESAGYGAGSAGLGRARVGVYAGAGMSDYALRNLAGAGVDGFELTLGNDKDFVATRASYKLDLRGPAMTVQTACSTSLVAIHVAVQALLAGECEMALAGGVSVQLPQAGYHYQEGGIASPDGHNRAFDAKALGTVGGNGVGVVVLKPLEAALADGDPIHAVIKGTALSNDGSGKVGFTAPSEEGEAEAIAEALALAGVDPGTIGYVEAHGSATPLGDPIEVAALNRVFRGAAPAGSRAVGSVKTNVGHTGSAAGVAGFLRAALAVEHGEVPPSLHFETPNPRIDFAAGPFRVPAAVEPWPETGGPRRAGVSSFGLGGTNAHVVLEEAPAPAPSGPARPWQLLSLSARTRTALEAATDRLAAWLEAHPQADLADVAFTLHVGRKAFEQRRTLVCGDRGDAVAALQARDPRRLLESSVDPAASRSIAFVFSGIGEQYPGMARELYAEEPVFQEELDRCAEILLPLLGEDVRPLLFEGEGKPGDLRRLFGRAAEREASPLDRTAVLQPALFAVEYALARLWMEWGVVPGALLGYSLGEYVAACVAGVLSLEDALKLVTGRARLVAELPPGAMLAVPLPADEVEPILPGELSLAVVNGPRISVVAGPPEAVAAFRSRLESEGHACRALQTTHAFHSAMMAPAAEGLTALAREVTLHPPRIPYLSNVTGTWITPEQATDPGYWAGHLVRTVRFADGVAALWEEPGRVLLEIGPGQSLSALALQHPATAGLPDPVALPSLPGAFERRPEGAFLLDTLGKLWLAGVKVDWPRVYARERRRRVELPPYPFERKRFWLEASPAPRPRSAEILYVPAWRRSMPLPPTEDLTGRWLLFADGDGLAERIAARLEAAGASVAIVAAGERFEGDAPDRIIHFGTFESLLLLVHELAARRPPEELATLRALLVSTPGHPEQGPIAALGQALARELPGLVARSVEVSLPSADWRWDRLAGDLLAELAREAEPWEAPVSLRGAERWVRSFEPVPPREGDLPAGPLLLVGDLPQPLRAAVGAAVVEAPLDGPFPAGDFIGVIVGEIVPEAPLLPLGAVTRTEALTSLQTAARRLDALERALEGKAPGFVLLTSSLDALSARPAHGVLGAVHALVDAFAERERPLPWTSVAWDFESGIDPLAVLRRLLAHGPVARAVAVAEDPAARLARSEEAPPQAIALHARPNLRNPYVPPGTDLERAIAEMWQTLLGIEEVGVHDSFFDLGGDSLLATQVVTRVRERFGAEVTLPALFESPTPAGLAGLIEAARPAEGPSDADRLAELMVQLDSLSPEEVERMLAERGE